MKYELVDDEFDGEIPVIEADEYEEYLNSVTDNYLVPASTPMSGDCFIYKLSTLNGSNLGFYWGAEDGGAFTMKNANGATLQFLSLQILQNPSRSEVSRLLS